MVQKIATVSSVFAACDRLEAANERWNREDVRNEVGGGGYVVIDPLIKAWRELKPIREAAPTTPAELLHQVATTLESHITGFVGEAESQLSESQQVFDATVSELSQRLGAMAKELGEKESTLGELEADQVRLQEGLEESQQSFSDSQTENARVVQENDGYRGQIARLESEHKETIRSLQKEAKEQAQEHARERSRLGVEQAAALSSQRKELSETAEQSENRLMMLLDQERQEANVIASKLSGDLASMTQRSQSSREEVIALETRVKELNRHNEKLESDLGKQVKSGSKLEVVLEKQRTKASSVERDFKAYKEEHRLSGDLGSLQAAVVSLQAELRQQSAYKKE